MPAIISGGCWSPPPVSDSGGRVSPARWSAGSPRVNSPLDIYQSGKDFLASPSPPLPPRRKPSLDANKMPFNGENCCSEPNLIPKRLPSIPVEEFTAMKRGSSDASDGLRSESRGGSRQGSRKGRRRDTKDREVRAGGASAPPTRGDQVSEPITPLPDAPLTEPAERRRPHSRSLLRGQSTELLMTPESATRTKVPRPKRSRERQGATDIDGAHLVAPSSPPLMSGYPPAANFRCASPLVGSSRLAATPAVCSAAAVPVDDLLSAATPAVGSRGAARFNSHSPAVYSSATPAVGSRAGATPCTAPAGATRATPGTGASRGRSSSLARSSSLTKLSSRSTADLAASPLVLDGRGTPASRGWRTVMQKDEAAEDSVRQRGDQCFKHGQDGLGPLPAEICESLHNSSRGPRCKSEGRELFVDIDRFVSVTEASGTLNEVESRQDQIPVGHDYWDQSMGSDPQANSGDSGPRCLDMFTCTRGRRGVSNLSLSAYGTAMSNSAALAAMSQAADSTLIATMSSPNTMHGSKHAWVKGDVLGHGSLGSVYKALDQRTGEIFAVKEVRIDQMDEHDVKFKKALENEVTICQELKHPHIVSYLGHDYIESRLYIYLEFMAGGSLAQVLSQFGPLEEELTCTYTRALLEGLKYLHSRDPPVLHRDIKGANILVGLDCRVKLSDFGCSKRTSDTMCHTMRGSIPWMAPEVIKQDQNGYGRMADIWSLGCVVIEMGTAKHPWGHFDNIMVAMKRIGMSEEIPAYPEGCSDKCKEFLECCLKRDKTQRKPAKELLELPFVKDVLVE